MEMILLHWYYNNNAVTNEKKLKSYQIQQKLDYKNTWKINNKEHEPEHMYLMLVQCARYLAPQKLKMW